jgi:hypothetical protein
MDQYVYTVPISGDSIQASGEWTTEAPESSYGQKVLVLTTDSGERVVMSKIEAESVYHVRKL